MIKKETPEKQEIMEQAMFIMETGRLIHDRIHQVLRQISDNNRKSGFTDLSMPQMDAIKAIRKQGEVTITKLSEILKVSPPSTSAMVDRLVEKGILVRERSRKDRRKVVVSVTKKTAENIEKIEIVVLKTFTEMVEKVGPETARKWCELLATIKAAIEE